MKPWFIWRCLLLLVIVLLVAGLSGCVSLSYYGQSIAGQWELWQKRQPIDDLLASAETPAPLRKKLQMVLAMRDFASTELALPDNDSYRSYADLQRPYVVWNVFAAPRFGMDLKRWCFPFAGCVGYRGYFARQDARAFARRLAAQGLETYVGGVAAYSTLGWFDDPLLNTVLKRSPVRVAGLIFHELAHQQLYVEGDTAFNEGFATTVQLEGVRRWLAKHGDERQRHDYVQFQQRQKAFVDLVTDTRDRLRALYARPLSAAEKRLRKQALQAALREQYQRLKQQWGGYDGYDAWFAGPLNNAQLAALTTYRDQVPAFQRLLAEQGGDLAAFYRACAALGALPMAQRQQALAETVEPRAVSPAAPSAASG
ncbi:MAG TPA: aminopeptidase [Gammaproteobacteria bacterium]|nr:aminopeptidase [Gammaproteobacteria bacterium]